MVPFGIEVRSVLAGLVALVAYAVPGGVLAQEPVDTVYLMDGGRLRGTVLVDSKALGVRILLLDGTTRDLPADEVKLVQRGGGATPGASMSDPRSSAPEPTRADSRAGAPPSSDPTEATGVGAVGEVDPSGLPRFFFVGFSTTGLSLYEYLEGRGVLGIRTIPTFATSIGACLGARVAPGIGVGGTAVMTFTYWDDVGAAPFGLFGPCAVFSPTEPLRLEAFAGFRGGGSFAYGGIGGGWGTAAFWKVYGRDPGSLSVDLGVRIEMGLHVETAGNQDDAGFAFVPTAGASVAAW